MVRALRLWRRREDGAVAVEAALVIPILCFLVFGMLEFGFAMRDYASVSSMVRTGARIASTGADHGPGTCETRPERPPCTPASSPALAQEAADAIQRSGAATEPRPDQLHPDLQGERPGLPGRGRQHHDADGLLGLLQLRQVRLARRRSSGSATAAAAGTPRRSAPASRLAVQPDGPGGRLHEHHAHDDDRAVRHQDLASRTARCWTSSRCPPRPAERATTCEHAVTGLLARVPPVGAAQFGCAAPRRPATPP